jgi:hypothetical protein
MKTNVIMNRSMGGLTVNQRTKDGMFNATKLLEQWNKSKGLTGRKGKRIDDFLKLKSTEEFINALNEEILNTDDVRYSEVYKSTRGKNGGTWMHPYLFIDFSMWINPKFKVQVIKFVYDELIKNRHSAGDNYKLLSTSVVKLKGFSFSEVATAMNWIVFDKKGKNLRQNATQEQLKELSDIQTKLSFAIDMGYIKSYRMLIAEMQEMYRIKKRKTPF